MRKANKFVLMIFMMFAVISCDNAIESNDIGSSGVESITNESSSMYESSDNFESSTIVELPKEYEKDENGFYVLEDDYFKDIAKEDNKQISKLRFSDDIPNEYVYQQMRLYAADKQIPLYNCKTNIANTWNALAPSRMNNSVAIMELEGKMTFKLQCNFAILNECVIRPLAANVEFKIDDNRRVIEFTITSPGQYTIELRSRRTLHLFVNSYGEFDNYKNESNLIYFGPGFHNKDNSKYIDSNNTINVNSNTTIFLEYGAILQGRFHSYKTNNIKIVGGGIIDGSVFVRDANKNIQTIPYDFNFCSNIKFHGIVTTDPAGWCYNIYFCNQVVLDNIKIISSRSNGDGISIQSCQNVLCKNSFVRSWDDSLVVKNYRNWSNNSQGTTKNIVFENCVLWTDLAQSMEIGFETVGKVMEDITFNNITVLHNYHKAVISIHNGNNANIKNVKFTNITIEDASMGNGDGNKYLIEISCEYSSTWSDKNATTELGSVDNVIIENVLVIDGIDDYKVSIRGSIDSRDNYKNSVHKVSNVTIKDVGIYGTLLTEDYENYSSNQYCENISFISSNNKVSGSNNRYIDSFDYGSNYVIEVI